MSKFKIQKQFKAIILLLLLVLGNALSTCSSLAQPWLNPTPPSSGTEVPQPPSSNSTSPPKTGVAAYPPINSPQSPINSALNQANTVAPTTTLVQQAAEQDFRDWQALDNLLNTNDSGDPNGPVFQGIQAAVYYTFGLGWMPNLGKVVAKMMQVFITSWLAPILGRFFFKQLMNFSNNPDVSFSQDGFSTNVRQMSHLVRDFSFDLLLLFFILAIWRYWNNAVWGSGRLWGALGRIIVATAAIIAWPEIYHYTILISNSASSLLVQGISPNEIGSAIETYLMKAVSFDGTRSAGQQIPFDWLFELVLNLAIGIATLVSLIAYCVEKAIQLTIIIMAYVFGPFFLVFLVSPDTDSYGSKFIRVFVEATLWNFIWGGLIALMVYILNNAQDPNSMVSSLSAAAGNITNNPQNPWFILFLILGILQAMLQVPHYLSSGHLQARTGIFEVGFALAKMKSVLGLFYGGSGLFNMLRHGISNFAPNRQALNSGPGGGGAGGGQAFNSFVGGGPGGGGAGTGGAVPGGGTIGGGTRGAGFGGGVTGGTGGSAGIVGAGGVGAGAVGGTGGGTGTAGVGGTSSASFGVPLSGGTAGSSPPPLIASARKPKTLLVPNGKQGLDGLIANYAHDKINNSGDALVKQAKEGSGLTQPYIDFKGEGEVGEIVVPHNASGPTQALAVTSAALVSSLTDRSGKLTKAASGALTKAMVRRSFFRGGPLNPFNSTTLQGEVAPGIFDRTSLWLSNGKASDGFKHAMEKRAAKVKNRVLMEGVNAYMNDPEGKSHHPIAKLLRDQRGVFDDEARTHAIYQLTTDNALSGGLNPDRELVGKVLGASGLSKSGTNYIAASPRLIREGMTATERKLVIPAVANYLRDCAGEYYGEDKLFHPNDPKQDMPATALYRFYEQQVMPHVQDEHIQAMAAIQSAHGLDYVTKENVDRVITAKRQHFGNRMDKNAFSSCLNGIVTPPRGNNPPTIQVAPVQMAAYRTFTGRIPW